jgi:hypothetical protein
MLLDKKFSSANGEFFSIAAIYHALLIAVENRVLPITGIKLLYFLGWLRSSE